MLSHQVNLLLKLLVNEVLANLQVRNQIVDLSIRRDLVHEVIVL